MSGRTASERVEELAVEQELKSKQFRVQRMETQEEAAKVEVTDLSFDFCSLLFFAIVAVIYHHFHDYYDFHPSQPFCPFSFIFYVYFFLLFSYSVDFEYSKTDLRLH